MNGYSPLEILALLNSPQYYGDQQLLQIQPYAYVTTITSLAPAGTFSTTINIAANADFLLLGIAHRATVAAAAQTVSNKTAPCVRVLLTDTGSGEQFTAQAIDLETWSRNGVDGPYLTYPRLLQGRTAVQLQATSYAAAETYAPMDIVLDGVLVRAYRQALLQAK